MNVFDKISAQQGKERTAVWMVGEQLKDIICNSSRLQEIVEQDLENEAMNLSACEKKIKAFADKHKTGNFACVTPADAEDIIREFYGLNREEEAKPASNVVDLTSFF